jgi:hypothetical protein
MLGSVELKDEGGAAAIEAKLNQVLGSFEGATVSVVAGGLRGQSKNTLIARILQAAKRNPFYLDAQAMEAIRFALRGLTASAYSTRKRALEIVGELMLNAIGRNVDKQANPDGSGFKALSPNYAAYKRRVFGFVIPVTRATGDLLKGLKYVVGRIR